MSKYQVDWLSDFGYRKYVIADFHKLEYARSVNTIGSMVLTMPRGNWNYENFKVGDILEIWREYNGSLSLQNETAYFVQSWRMYVDSSGKELVDVLAYDANWLLDTAIVAYASESAEASKTGEADDMLKEIVSENLGADAVTARQKLTVAPDLTLAPSITKAFAWRNLFRVCQEIAEQSTEEGTKLFFDVVRTAPATFEFRTYTGQRGRNHGRDSGDIRLVGRDYGNLFEAEFGTYHNNERNYIYVGGQGREADRTIVEVSNATRIASSKWNRRELFQDARNDDTTASLTSEGESALDENKPQQVMTGRLVDIPGMRFDIEYGFGDILSVQAFGYFVDCHVATVNVRVDGTGGEQIDIRLRGEL